VRAKTQVNFASSSGLRFNVCTDERYFMALWRRLRESRWMHNLLALPLLLLPYWVKWADPPAPFAPTYVMGFLVSAAMLLAVIVWLLLGMPGITRFAQRGAHLSWAVMWGVFVFWAFITQTWAFVEKAQPGVAQNFGLQMALVGSYAIMLACAAPAPRFVIGLLTLDAMSVALIGGTQVACQCSLGLKALGEVTLNVARSGVSVIQGEGIRWLRPYGFLPHPNIAAGFLAVGVFAGAGVFLGLFSRRDRTSMHVFPLAALSLVIWAAIAWVLMLTFSRGAWLGVGIGGLAVLAGLIGRRDFRKPLIALALLAIGLSAVFFVLYRPLIVARTGAGQENTEMRSLADRVVYGQIAQAAIARAPVIGLGAGNTPWYAAYYLATYTDYDLQGDHVHNIYLETWSDLGVIGLVLFGLMQGFGLFAAGQAYRRTGDVARLMMIGGWIGLAIVGLFDHYPWSLIMGQTLWVTLLAMAMAEAPMTTWQNS